MACMCYPPSQIRMLFLLNPYILMFGTLTLVILNIALSPKFSKTPYFPRNNSAKCSSYFLEKLAKIPLALMEHKSQKPFDIVHSDVWGPFPILSNLGFRYFVIFIDDYTRHT